MKLARNTLYSPFALLIALAAAFAGCATVPDKAPVRQQEIQRAELTLDQFQADPQMASFRSGIKSAKAVIIVPNVTRAALLVGGSGGEAVVLARDKSGNRWSEPAFYCVASGSVGVQLGVDVSEVVMLVMSDKALDALLSRTLVLGGGASFAMGGTGIGEAGGITADVVGYALSRGMYAGVSLEGAMIKPDAAANEEYYGRPASAADVLVRRDVWNPVSAALQRSLASLSQWSIPLPKEST